MYDAMSETMKEYFAYNPSKSSLSGGISGITEDTARHLEGLQNAMLTQLIFISQGMTDLSRGGFAQVQTSWFNDLLLQTRIIQTATSEMNQAIKDMRNGVRPMSVKISN
jgi:hypothetical protein